MNKRAQTDKTFFESNARKSLINKKRNTAGEMEDLSPPESYNTTSIDKLSSQTHKMHASVPGGTPSNSVERETHADRVYYTDEDTPQTSLYEGPASPMPEPLQFRKITSGPSTSKTPVLGNTEQPGASNTEDESEGNRPDSPTVPHSLLQFPFPPTSNHKARDNCTHALSNRSIDNEASLPSTACGVQPSPALSYDDLRISGPPRVPKTTPIFSRKPSYSDLNASHPPRLSQAPPENSVTDLFQRQLNTSAVHSERSLDPYQNELTRLPFINKHFSQENRTQIQTWYDERLLSRDPATKITSELKLGANTEDIHTQGQEQRGKSKQPIQQIRDPHKNLLLQGGLAHKRAGLPPGPSSPLSQEILQTEDSKDIDAFKNRQYRCDKSLHALEEGSTEEVSQAAGNLQATSTKKQPSDIPTRPDRGPEVSLDFLYPPPLKPLPSTPISQPDIEKVEKMWDDEANSSDRRQASNALDQRFHVGTASKIHKFTPVTPTSTGPALSTQSTENTPSNKSLSSSKKNLSSLFKLKTPSMIFSPWSKSHENKSTSKFGGTQMAISAPVINTSEPSFPFTPNFSPPLTLPPPPTVPPPLTSPLASTSTNTENIFEHMGVRSAPYLSGVSCQIHLPEDHLLPSSQLKPGAGYDRGKYGLGPLIVRKSGDQRRHRHHMFEWGTRKLSCDDHEVQCSICETQCCVLIQVKRDLSLLRDTDSANNLEKIKETERLVREIESRPPGMVDSFPTMQYCSRCSRKVCPGCCGRCVNGLCSEVICSSCGDPDPWAVCRCCMRGNASEVAHKE